MGDITDAVGGLLGIVTEPLMDAISPDRPAPQPQQQQQQQTQPQQTQRNAAEQTQQNEARSRQAGQRERQRAALSQGRSSTVLTSPQGLGERPARRTRSGLF